MSSLTGIIDVHSHAILSFGRGEPVGAGNAQPEWSVEMALDYMEEYDIAACVLSVPDAANYATGAEAREIAGRINETLSRIVARHPNPFAALASLQEIDRRGATLFVHPSISGPGQRMLVGLNPTVIEYMFETTRMAVNKVVTGAKQRFSNIKVISTHAGGTIPFLVNRLQTLEHTFGVEPGSLELSSDEVREGVASFHYDLTAATSEVQLGALLKLVPASQMLMGLDLPFMPRTSFAAAIADLTGSPSLDAADRERWPTGMRSVCSRPQGANRAQRSSANGESGESMRFANHNDRLTLIEATAPEDLNGARGIDLHEASGGAIPSDPVAALDQWDEVLAAARSLPPDAAAMTIDPARLGPPTPRPRQIFGIGINYADHGAESGMQAPEVPLVFTKLGTAVTGPFDPIGLSSQSVDWEVEVVVVIGRGGSDVPIADAWDVVAGVTAGQDLSDRDIQWRPQSSPQFGLGKSLRGFAPMGPTLATPDEYSDPGDIELACHLNGKEVQRSRSSEMLLSVAELVAYLSAITPLLPGDAIFTGTPSGIGMTRTPPRYLTAGDSLQSWVQGVGTMSHTFTAVPAAQRAVG